MQKRIVTLLTDFGLSDTYVAVMKGVILGIEPQATIVDLTHEIPPQNIAAACFNLQQAYAYFPSDTIHIGVVDPGVGGLRRPIAIATDRGLFVAPDNGLLTGILERLTVKQAVVLANPSYWRVTEPSSTFHGRDIFAPVGAHLARGIPLYRLGEPIDPQTLVRLLLPTYTLATDTIATDTIAVYRVVGAVQYIDRFGNLITNIPADRVQEWAAGRPWVIAIGDRRISSRRFYDEGDIGELSALANSDGWIEISVNCGSARDLLQVDWGEEVAIVLHQD